MTVRKALSGGLLLVFLLPTVGVFAQNKAISAEDFYQIESSAKLYLSKNSYSSTEVNEWRNRKTSKISLKTESVRNVIPPSRSYERTQITERGKTSVFEEIVIGSTQYRSKGDGVWSAS